METLLTTDGDGNAGIVIDLSVFTYSIRRFGRASKVMEIHPEIKITVSHWFDLGY